MRKLLIAALAAFAMTQAAHAQSIASVLPAALKNAPTEARWHADRDFTPDIQRARKMLEGMTAGYDTTDVVHAVKRRGKIVGTKVVGKKLGEFNILLAVQHYGDPKIEVVKISNRGKMPDGYIVNWKKFNGLNTNFIVKKPLGRSVLAIKRVIGNGKRGFKEEIYTPYSAELDTPAMRAIGYAYLTATIDEAYQGLEKSGVASKAFPTRAIKDVLPRTLSFKLSVIEHIDPTRSEREVIEKLMNEVLVIAGANKKLAYVFAISRAKARGLFQFIPSTYASIVKKYPSAGLNPSFVAGMDDHVNAAKASLLLFDSDLQHMPAARRAELVKNPIELARYLAAAYNGGAPRAVRAYVDGKVSLAHLRIKETRNYVSKVDKVSGVID